MTRGHVFLQLLLCLELHATVKAVMDRAGPFVHIEASLGVEPLAAVEAAELEVAAALLLVVL